uniref:Uncharacterized protein n=1 Tax=Anguilla anguilla TaxID=7936 RepID=A0A0E9WYY1_ANGAN
MHSLWKALCKDTRTVNCEIIMRRKNITKKDQKWSSVSLFCYKYKVTFYSSSIFQKTKVNARAFYNASRAPQTTNVTLLQIQNLYYSLF